MMVCMAGLQVFIVRFFFQVCWPCIHEMQVAHGADKIIRVRERAMCKGLACIDRMRSELLGKYYGIGGVKLLCTFIS
jgi:hypothetical protein